MATIRGARRVSGPTTERALGTKEIPTSFPPPGSAYASIAQKFPSLGRFFPRGRIKCDGELLTALGRQIHASQDLIRLRATRNANDLIETEETFGEHLADGVARFGGSWTFIIVFGVAMIVYTAINIALHGRAWDPYPFILLNLFLSMLAAIQAPVIMMSQNRQDGKDRLRGELDFDVNRRAASDIQGLSRKLNLLDEKIDDAISMIRASGRT